MYVYVAKTVSDQLHSYCADVTAQLICTIVFAQVISRFSHDVAQVVLV